MNQANLILLANLDIHLTLHWVCIGQLLFESFDRTKATSKLSIVQRLLWRFRTYNDYFETFDRKTIAFKLWTNSMELALDYEDYVG